MTLLEGRTGRPVVRAWDQGVPMEPDVWKQVDNIAAVPGVERIAIMPDAHVGNGACVGSAILTRDVVLPAAVGVDIGCGMIAAPLELRRSELRDLGRLRAEIEKRVPVGRTNRGQKGDRGAWGSPPSDVLEVWQAKLQRAYTGMVKKRRELEHPFATHHLGTLGTGNHFLEVCIQLDTPDQSDPPIWLMLHSGSRGIGNRIGTWFTKQARAETIRAGIKLPDPELGFLSSETELFDDYLAYAHWAQEYAWQNRLIMFRRALEGMAAALDASSIAWDKSRLVHCFAGDTNVLTRRGVFPIRDLVDGEHELLTEGGRWVRAPVRAFGRQPLMKVVLSRNGVLKTVYATPGHRWLLRAFGATGNAYIRRRTEATTAQLLPGDRLAYAFPGQPPERGLDREAVARGFLFGDGYVNAYGTARAQFCGPKDEALDSAPAYLYGWLAGYFSADGDVGKTGRPTLASARRANLETVRTLAAQVGVGTYGVRMRMRRGYGQTDSPLYLVGLMRGDLDARFFVLPAHRERCVARQPAVERRGWTVVSVEPTDRVEEVFCAQVEGTHSFTLEDNILTGNCHHNYVAQEEHFGGPGLLTRKGAVNAEAGVMGIIPGSMGARSYITRGKGHAEALKTSSHGAGRVMSRNVARKSITLEQHLAALAGVECRTDPDVIDESPACYKDIAAVMAAQAELTEPVHTLKQIVVVKG